MFDSLTPSAENVRSTQRRVLLMLLLVAVGLTVVKYFYDRSRVADRPLEWKRNVDAAVIEADVSAGMPVLVFIARPDDRATQDWLDMLESSAVRQQMRLLGATPVRIDWPVHDGALEQTTDADASGRQEKGTDEFGDWQISRTPIVLLLLPEEEKPRRFDVPSPQKLVEELRQARIR